MDELPELMDAYDRLVASAVGAADEHAVEQAARVARRVRARRGYLGSTVVVALAGGTGSGKSSTVNALAGEEVSLTSSRRPTTSAPLAWIPANPEPGLVRLLDDIGIEERVGHQSHPDLAVIDLPDIDSVAFDHRATVERLLPEVDAVVWVVDPEKYQDRVLHAEHLAPLAEYQDQFLFVMNQIDRLPPGALDDVIDDFRSTLTSDGIADAMIIATAADPPIGPPLGMDELVTALEGLGDAKSVVHRKLVTDLERGAGELAEAAGVATGGGTGFARRWQEVVDRAASRIADDVLDKSVLAAARREGQRTARSATGLAPGSAAALELPLSESGAGVVAATRLIDDLITDLSEQVEGEVASDLRTIGMETDAEVAAAAETVRFGSSLPLPGPPEWTRTAAWFRRFMLVALVVAVIWLVQTVRSGEDLVIPIVVTAACVLALVVPWSIAGRVGARRASAAVRAQRQKIVAGAGREIDRRMGKPLREILRRRAGAAAAFTDFELAMRQAAERDRVS